MQCPYFVLETTCRGSVVFESNDSKMLFYLRFARPRKNMKSAILCASVFWKRHKGGPLCFEPVNYFRLAWPRKNKSSLRPPGVLEVTYRGATLFDPMIPTYFITSDGIGPETKKIQPIQWIPVFWKRHAGVLLCFDPMVQNNAYVCFFCSIWTHRYLGHIVKSYLSFEKVSKHGRATDFGSSRRTRWNVEDIYRTLDDTLFKETVFKGHIDSYSNRHDDLYAFPSHTTAYLCKTNES